ncbi:MAG: RagB/SusD family nutrient uptake outer membrane protein [Dysgonamonadaceae bacterium]|jgi:hypothetical protein|nr:RagB/SusD family nutrient uptake outer membrane protein [Dysgonamonadaceae bacterium]
MKNQFKYWILFLIPLAFASCEDYLNHYLKDQISLEETFATREGVERYLANVYSFLPNDYEQVDANTSTTSRSDEAYFSWTTWVNYLKFNNGSWTPETPNYHNWERYYKGINQASIFMENIDLCLEISSTAREQMKSEARFLRAYYYLMLVQQYGPVFVWGDRLSDENIDCNTVDRHPMDSCINFIDGEMQKAALSLSLTTNGSEWMGQATKGIALAARARLWLYAARPLYNGCTWYVGMKNYYGDFLFPQTPNPVKWRKAAEAAWEVINLSSDGINPLYKLYATSDADSITRANRSYSGVYFTPWNTEIIFGRWEGDGASWNRRALPPEIGLNYAYGGYSPSMKLVDTYPMQATGRFPVTGYERDGYPVIDPLSGYREEGFTENYVHPFDGDDNGSLKIKAHNSCVGRDARFYTSVFFSGMYWINKKFVRERKAAGAIGGQPVTFHITGTSPFSNKTGDYVKNGYLFRRLTNPNSDTQSGAWGNYSWAYIRLAEIFLSYAEAWIMMDESDRDALKTAGYASGIEYWNKIRERVSLNKIENAYPEINFNDYSSVNQKKMIDLLLKERMVEMAYENLRYYDIRQWMMGEKESNGPRYGRNLLANSYEDSWTRTSKICFPIVCLKKHHLFPIYQGQINEMRNITQNYGW